MTRILRSSFVIFAISIALTQTRTSQADSVQFSVGGNTYQVVTFDEAPGNAIAVGGQTAINNALATLTTPNSTATSAAFTVYYQATVTLIGTDGQTISTPGLQFTAVAAFNEVATVNNYSGTSNQVSFSLASDQSHLLGGATGGSYLDFFVQPAGSISNANGTGFATDNTGTLVYSANIPTSGSTGNFTNLGGSSPLGTGSSQQSVSGYGGTNLSVGTNYFNSNYFTGSNGSGSTLSFYTNNALTFNDVAPASKFIMLNQTGSTISGYSYYTPQLGTLNGYNGQDFQFQADASSSLSGTIPEPASIAMTVVGLGALGMGSFFSRRRAKTQAPTA